MYRISDEYKSKLAQAGIRKKGYLRLVPLAGEEEVIFTEKDLKDFSVLDDIYTPDEGIIGSVISKQITINLFNEINQDLTNREIEAYVGVDGEDDYIPLGRFIIQKPENGVETSKTYFEGLDYMIKFNKPFTDEHITYPIELRRLLWWVCYDCDLVLNTSYGFANDTWLVENNQFTNGETYRDVLRYILQVAGCYAKININNYGLDLYNINGDKEIAEELTSYDYKNDIQINNTFGGVNRLVIDMSQVTGAEVIREDTSLIQRDGVQEVRITDNPFLYTTTKRTEVIENLFNQIKGFKYTDFKCTILTAKPYLEAGDRIKITTTNGGEIETYLLTHEIKFDGGIKSEMSATAQTEVEKTYHFIDPVIAKTRSTELAVDRANARITAVISEGGEGYNSLTQITADLDGVEQEVSSFTDFTKNVGGTNRIKLDDALETSILSLVLNAENTDTGLYPSSTLYPSDSLYPRRAGDFFTIVVANDNAETIKKEYEIDIPVTLRRYNNVRDQLRIEFNQEKGTCEVKVYKYIEKNGDTYTILTNPKIITIYDDFDFTLYKGTNYIRIKEYTTWLIKASYLSNNELNKYYTTKVESSTLIKSTKDEITLQVEQQIGDETTGEKLISKINLAPEGTTIQGKNISLEGYTTINGGFSVDEEGNASIANGAVKIDTTGIQMADGTSVVGGKGLMSNLQFVGRSNINSNVVSGLYQPLGFWSNYSTSSNSKTQIIIDAYLPNNFTVESAYIVMEHFPIKIYNGSTLLGTGYSRKVKLYTSTADYRYLNFVIGSEFYTTEGGGNSEIANSGLGENGWTPINSGNNEVEQFISKDISSSLKVGNNKLVIESADDIPAYDNNYTTNTKNIMSKTGMVYATLVVFGFMSKNTNE